MQLVFDLFEFCPCMPLAGFSVFYLYLHSRKIENSDSTMFIKFHMHVYADFTQLHLSQLLTLASVSPSRQSVYHNEIGSSMGKDSFETYVVFFLFLFLQFVFCLCYIEKSKHFGNECNSQFIRFETLRLNRFSSGCHTVRDS